MIVDIQEPDHESRLAILKSKLQAHNIPIGNGILEYIAEASSNIRELEGALNVIICQTNLKNKELSLNEIKNIVKETTKPKRSISIKEVIKTISDFYDIPEDSIYEKSRRKEVVKPRQVIMYILREDFKISYPTIGEKLGGRDHTTVIHSCEKIKNDIKVDSILSDEISKIKNMLK
jgi:chromosomal replication initiator protein